MSLSHVEVERAFSPGPETGLPDLTEVDDVSAVVPLGEHLLDATYYDVPGLLLLRAGVTLRRRTGGSDEGWHLKLPLSLPSARTELHADLDAADDGPPERLTELVAGWSRGVALSPVARIQSRRHTSRLLSADGTVLAELADDRVEGSPTQPGGELTSWREWEVELRAADCGLLDEVERLFADHGVEPSNRQWKLSVVLDAAPRPESAAVTGRLTKKAPAGRFLHRWMLDRVRELELLDPVVRDGQPGGVHGMRKACRRLRAALATYRPLLDRQQTDPVREELRWLARALGEARDDEVVLERIDGLLNEEPAEVNPEVARTRLHQYGRRRAEHDRSEVAAVLVSPRYWALRSALDALAAEPSWTARADGSARDVLRKLARKEGKRVRRRRDATDPHDLRKAGKRLRYAYELLEPGWPKAARGPRLAAQELTQLLGERQDTVASQRWLLALASEASRSGRSAFVFGRLHAIEERRELDLLDKLGPLWKQLDSRVW